VQEAAQPSVSTALKPNRDDSERGAALQRFLTAGWFMLTGWRKFEEWGEFERRAYKLIGQIAMGCVNPPDSAYASIYRRALKGFDVPTFRRRFWSLRAAAHAGSEWRRAPNNEVVARFALELQSIDPLFDWEFDWPHSNPDRDGLPAPPTVPAFTHAADVECIQDLLSRYDTQPRGKANKVGAEHIIAEIVVRHAGSSKKKGSEKEYGALGFELKRGESDVDAIERIRKSLSRVTAEQ
jgi:hypothetical protein